MSARPPDPSGTGPARRWRPRTRPPARVPMTLAVLLLLFACFLAPAARVSDPWPQTVTPVTQVTSTDVRLTAVPVVDVPPRVVRVVDAPPVVVPVVVVPPVVVPPAVVPPAVVVVVVPPVVVPPVVVVA
jgi:hypothetical protein